MNDMNETFGRCDCIMSAVQRYKYFSLRRNGYANNNTELNSSGYAYTVNIMDHFGQSAKTIWRNIIRA